MRFEIEVELGGKTYGYSIAFELPKGAKNFACWKKNSRLAASPFTREKSGERSLMLNAATASIIFRSTVKWWRFQLFTSS